MHWREFLAGFYRKRRISMNLPKFQGFRKLSFSWECGYYGSVLGPGLEVSGMLEMGG